MAEVMLYDRDGNPNTYDTGNGVRLYSEDGTAQDFISASPVETTIQPDFSEGDMEVSPGENELFSKVVIEKPETLIPENIAEGVDIAGIIGSLPPGANIKTSTGSLTGNNGTVTVTHGLGVVPDIVFVYCTTGETSATVYTLKNAYGVSTNFKTKSGWSWGITGMKSKGSTYGTFSFSAIDTTVANCVINNTTEQTMKVGSNAGGTAPTRSGATYEWLAIGGLT